MAFPSDSIGEGFLNIQMLALIHSMTGYRCVHIIGGANNNAVNSRLVFQHFPIVSISLRFFLKRRRPILTQRVGQRIIVNIKNRIDIL